MYKIIEGKILLNEDNEALFHISEKVLYESKFVEDIILKLDKIFESKRCIPNKAYTIYEICSGKQVVNVLSENTDIEVKSFNEDLKEISDNFSINRVLLVVNEKEE